MLLISYAAAEADKPGEQSPYHQQQLTDQKQRAGAKGEQKAQVPPAIAPWPEVRGATTPIRREDDRHLRYPEVVQ